MIKEIAASGDDNSPPEASAVNPVDSTYSQVDELGNRVCSLIELIQSSNGLDAQQARTLVYVAIATYGLPSLEKFPILAILGPAGTGKTTLLEVLRQLAYKPSKELIDGKATGAVLRDTLALANEVTALIDEADGVEEKWIQARYAKQTGNIKVNRPVKGGKWKQQEANLFGATALHRRQPFKDPAVLSRSIVIRTRTAEVDRYVAEEFAEYKEVLAEIAELVEWTKVIEREGDRITDTWAPLLEVDALFGGQWTPYAEDQMKGARQNLDFGHETEPSQAVFNSFLSPALDENGHPLERVMLGSIAKSLSDAESLSSYQVAIILSDMGFAKQNRGGNMYIYTGGRDKLVAIGRELGLEDEWFEDENAAGV